MICCNHKSKAFGIKFITQLGNGNHKTGMLDLGKKFINLGTLSPRFPFFLKDGEHLLQRIKKLAEKECMLALVVKGHLDMLGIGNMTSRVAFTGIMVTQGKHVMTTILMTHNGTNPVLSEFTSEIADQRGVDMVRIGLIVLTGERSMSNHPLSEGKVLHSVFRFFFFMNNNIQYAKGTPLMPGITER